MQLLSEGEIAVVKRRLWSKIGKIAALLKPKCLIKKMYKFNRLFPARGFQTSQLLDTGALGVKNVGDRDYNAGQQSQRVTQYTVCYYTDATSPGCTFLKASSEAHKGIVAIRSYEI